MPKQPGIADYLTSIAKALKGAGVRWYVFGAQAVVAAGAVRVTADIDITTEDVPVELLRGALKKAGFVVRSDIADVEALIEHHRILPLEHSVTGMQLDVVRAGPGPEEDMLQRVVLRRVGRVSIPFVSTNDLLVLKTLAGREKDLEDIRALVRSASDEIDVAVVRRRLDEIASLIDDSTLRALFDQQLKKARRG